MGGVGKHWAFVGAFLGGPSILSCFLRGLFVCFPLCFRGVRGVLFCYTSRGWVFRCLAKRKKALYINYLQHKS